MLFGWAKPVPYNPQYFKNLRKGELITGFAGPASNLALALIGSALAWSGVLVATFSSQTGEGLYFVGYTLALRSLVRSEPEMGFLEGVRSGALMSVIAAICAVLGQVVYFHFLNPGWTEYMVGQTREHFAALGLDAAQIAEMAEGARTTFGFASYATQAGLGALFQGHIFSPIIMGVLRWSARR